MLFNTEISIALKDSFGRYEIIDFSIFDFTKINNRYNWLQIKLNKNKQIVFNVKCILCGKNHYYRYSVCDIVKRDILIGGCEVLGIPLFYIGNKEKVLQKIGRYVESNSIISSMI